MMSDIIRELREDKGLTQTELANILNVSRQSISGYENGLVEPTISTLIKLADLYNCSLDYLTGRTKERYNLNLYKKDTKNLLIELIEVVEKYQIKKK